MTNLSLNSSQKYSPLAGQGNLLTALFAYVGQAISPSAADVDKEFGFLDAWVFSSNGQG